MFNPLYPFTHQVLEETIKRGCMWFVRNTYVLPERYYAAGVRACFILTHYNDIARAEAHFNSIASDNNRFLYDWKNEDHRKRLRIAASNPPEFKVYSAYFLPDYKKQISKEHKEKINRFIFKKTGWSPGRGETVHIDVYLHFGIMYLSLRYAGEELKIKFADIETVS